LFSVRRSSQLNRYFKIQEKKTIQVNKFDKLPCFSGKQKEGDQKV